MSSFKRLIQEIHRRSLWQVLGIYLVISWGVLEAVGGIASTAGLPEWLPSLALILLLIGLPIVLATAFVQEGLGRAPDPVSDDAPGRTPSRVHTSGATSLFTWRNALGGGGAALGLWAVVATALLLRGGASTTEVAGAQPSIAVIPFDNMASAENQYFTDGIHEDIITALTQVGGMKVISRTSVLVFADPESRPSIPEIARLLGVQWILEGSVRREGDRVRVTAQLIDGRKDGHLWAQQYDRDVVDVFALQADLAREIASQLGATLTPDAASQLARVPTRDPVAYELYVRARGLDQVAGGMTALRMLNEAIARDPGFALAWALHSNRSGLAYSYGRDRTPERIEASLESAERAFELAPDLPEANLALGLHYYRIERDYPRALDHLARASQLRPGWARAAQAEGWIARRAGQFDLAAQKHREAVDLDPLNFDTRDDLAQTLGYMREFEEADEWSRSAFELGGVDRDTYIHRAALLLHWRGDLSGYQQIPARRPISAALVEGDTTALREHALPATEQWYRDNQLLLTPMALIHAIYYAWTGDDAARNRKAETAVELLEPRLTADPDDPRPRASLALAYAYLGRAADAVREADRAVELAQNDTYRIQSSELRRMWVHTVLGDANAAAIAFERNVTLQGLGWSVRGLLTSPFLDSVRDDPAFAAMVERLREEGH